MFVGETCPSSITDVGLCAFIAFHHGNISGMALYWTWKTFAETVPKLPSSSRCRHIHKLAEVLIRLVIIHRIGIQLNINVLCRIIYAYSSVTYTQSFSLHGPILRLYSSPSPHSHVQQLRSIALRISCSVRCGYGFIN